MMEDQFTPSGDGGGGVGPMNIHFSYQKFYLSTDRHDDVFGITIQVILHLVLHLWW